MEMSDTERVGGGLECIWGYSMGGGGVKTFVATGRNKRREWGDVRQTTNGLFLCLLLRSGHKKSSDPQRCLVSFPKE